MRGRTRRGRPAHAARQAPPRADRPSARGWTTDLRTPVAGAWTGFLSVVGWPNAEAINKTTNIVVSVTRQSNESRSGYLPREFHVAPKRTDRKSTRLNSSH